VERILEAALHAFAAKGYRATTLDSIGRAAGVTGPAIYRHFAGKQELYLAVREWAAAAQITEAMARAEALPPALAARELLKAHAHVAANRPEWVRVWLTGHDDLPKELASTLAHERAYHERWQTVVAALRPDLPPAKQAELVSLVRGAATATVWFGSTLPPEEREVMLVQAGLAVLYSSNGEGAEPSAALTDRPVPPPSAE
jgi:AcrR family transcriptional regulator